MTAGFERVEELATHFERVEELATQSVGLFERSKVLTEAKAYDDASRLNDRAEHLLYEMMGMMVIFDSPMVWPILEVYKAAEVIQEYNGDDIPLLQTAYDMLKEYAYKTSKNREEA